MKQRYLILLSILAILALVFTACGPADEDGVEPTEPGVIQPTEPGMIEPTEPGMVEPTEPAMVEPTEPAMVEPTEPAGEATEPAPAATEPAGEATEPAAVEGGTVSVLVVWGDAELESFQAMLQPFEERTGITVEIESTRDLNAVLTTRVEGGNPPDVAGLPGPGQLVEFARTGDLVPLDFLDRAQLEENYDTGWLDLASENDQLYGIFIKATAKSLVWYRPDVFEQNGWTVPTTWEELNNLEQQIIDSGATPWCIGLESGAASGWPGTDWIEDIMLRTAGPETYDQWWQHEIEWTNEEVRNAWETWGTIVNDPTMVYGGLQYVLSTNFGEAPFPMFQDPPQCYLHRQASFVTDFIQQQFPDLEPGVDYTFFTFPPIDEQYGNPLLVAGDLLGMFNDTPQARALIEYLTSAEAQEIWAQRGGFLAPNRQVSPDVYPDEITGQIAEMITTADAVRFDASDLMPEAVNNAFWRGILDYVSAPDNLDSILESIEGAAQDAYPSE